MMTPAALVACNIYVTAAASHSSTLISLLRRAQEQCRQLRLKENDDEQNTTATATNNAASVAIIHAYADLPYDRSSFHLAGTSECVSDVASTLICNALNEIDLDDHEYANNEESRHPFVGLVDHVSVMPISYPMNNNYHDSSSNDSETSCEAAADAAREIGKQISKTNLVNVHYYGRACPQNTSLAKVRRERTSFFKSGGAIDNTNQVEVGPNKDDSAERGEDSSTLPNVNVAVKEDATIGTPQHFVENFNIRLTSNVDFDQAKTLTQFVRGRNIITKGYGVAGVEALTLPYVRGPSEGGNVYEVACNLTNPQKGGVDQIRAQLETWTERQEQKDGIDESRGKTAVYEYFVEDAYFVGTSEKQCMDVLSGKNYAKEAGSFRNDVYWEEYDRKVLHRFQGILL